MAFETEKLEVANGALLRLGASRIDSINEASDRARLCKQWLERVRPEALRAHPWNFALVRDQLNSYPQATLTPSATAGAGVTFTASAGVFASGDVRYRLIGNSGIARIKSFVSTTVVTADIETAFADTSAIAIEGWRIAPAWRYDFRFAKPTGYLRVIEVEGLAGLTSPSGGSFTWSWWQHRDNSLEPVKVEGQYLVTDVGGKMNMQYIQDVEDPTLWDALCRNAIEALLSFRICYGITGSLQAAKTQHDAYQAAINEARTADGQEGTADDVGSDILIAVRQ